MMLEYSYGDQFYDETFCATDWRPLHWAAFYGHATAVEKLLDYGACVDARNDWNQTALHYGIITTIAGTVASGSSGDGDLATKATLYQPYGVAIDSKGNIYIADSLGSETRTKFETK